jgi:murein DD-endopeptidase MepM/ murein hydrolase activator NlpD
MRKVTALGAFLLVLLPTRLPYGLDSAPSLGSEPVVRDVVASEALTVVEGRISRNDTLASALSGVASPALVDRIVRASRPAYDLTRIVVGRPFGITLGPDGLLRAFSYGIDELRTLHVDLKDGEPQARVAERPVETRTAVVAGVIESSLFGAVDAAGEGDQLALDLADVFAWDVDFNTELQPGDSFRVAVEKQCVEGELLRYGRILAAEFVRGPRTLRAVRHEAQGQAPGYYDTEGRPLRKAFLRSPLRFTRISSRFSRSRLHPVLNVRRPHLGVDYAAPYGTPVHAAADGLVVGAGWEGGYGRTVRIRHANGYQTLYGHLARIAVRAGQRVVQGTLVGAVGASGLATGPHLDYRMSLNGRFLDPLKVALPPAEPIAPSEREAFATSSRRLLAMLEGAPAPAPAQVQAASGR